PDGARQRGALVQRLEDAVVDLVNAAAQPLELRVAQAGSSRGIERTESTPGMRAMRATNSGAAALSRSTSVYAMSPRDLFTMLWMLRPACAIVVEICPSMLGTFAFAMAMRWSDSRAISTL